MRISHRVSTAVLCGLFLICACYFATFGSGNYTYEAAVGDPPDSLLVDSLVEPDTTVIPETLDDDFDLIDFPDQGKALEGKIDNGKGKTIGAV